MPPPLHTVRYPPPRGANAGIQAAACPRFTAKPPQRCAAQLCNTTPWFPLLLHATVRRSAWCSRQTVNDAAVPWAHVPDLSATSHPAHPGHLGQPLQVLGLPQPGYPTYLAAGTRRAAARPTCRHMHRPPALRVPAQPTAGAGGAPGALDAIPTPRALTRCRWPE